MSNHRLWVKIKDLVVNMKRHQNGRSEATTSGGKVFLHEVKRI